MVIDLIYKQQSEPRCLHTYKPLYLSGNFAEFFFFARKCRSTEVECTQTLRL